jgi:hypothetical protein
LPTAAQIPRVGRCAGSHAGGTWRQKRRGAMDTLPFGRTGHDSSRVIFGAAAFWGMTQEKADQVLDLLLE